MTRELLAGLKDRKANGIIDAARLLKTKDAAFDTYLKRVHYRPDMSYQAVLNVYLYIRLNTLAPSARKLMESALLTCLNIMDFSKMKTLTAALKGKVGKRSLDTSQMLYCECLRGRTG